MTTKRRVKPKPAAKTARTKSAAASRAGKTARKPKPASPSPVYSAEDIAKALQLTKGSDSIELKVALPASRGRAMVRALRLDPVEAQPRQAFFFDTLGLDLYKAGLVVRVRRIQGGRADTVVKLRPVDPERIDTNLRRSAGFKVELDMMPGGFVCSASFRGLCTGKEVLRMTEGDVRLASLFTKEQRAFYRAHAPKGLDLDSLVTLGPVFLLRAKQQPANYDRTVTVELWLYPDGSQILELSTKCLPEEAFQASTEFKAFLARCGVPLRGVQEPKTRYALEFFRKHRD